MGMVVVGAPAAHKSAGVVEVYVWKPDPQLRPRVWIGTVCLLNESSHSHARTHTLTYTHPQPHPHPHPQVS